MKQISHTKKIYYLLLVIITCFILLISAFRYKCVDIINDIIVNPFASKLTNVAYSITIGLLIIIYYILFTLKERAIHTKRVSFAVAIAVIHILAVVSDQWEYYAVDNSKFLVYGNVFLLPLICEIGLYIYRIILKHKEYIIQVFRNITLIFQVERKSNDIDSFFEYESCHTTNDSYKRTDFFNEVSIKLKKAFFSEGSFALGITGMWGSGKSTMLTELIKDVESDNCIDVCFEFNPWSCDSADQIIANFIATYKAHIKEFIPDLSTEIDNYAKLIINSVDTSFTLSSVLHGAGNRLFSTPQTLQAQFEVISSKLKKNQVKCVIFIDDMDRLNYDEIMAILRLIRNTANFPNTIFVVAYDKEYIVSTMQNNNIISPANYLNKIFNLEIQLPKYEEYAICSELLDRFAAYFKFDRNSSESAKYRAFIEKSITGNESKENSLYLVPKILITNRDVIRFFNSFKLICELVKKRDMSIVISDLFYIELLRYKFKPLYEIIRDNPSSILVRDTNSLKDFEFYTYEKESIDTANEVTFTPEYELNLVVDNILKDYTATDIMLAKYIMKNELFSSYGMSVDSISSVVAIGRYFSFQFEAKNLPMVEFNQIVNTPLEGYDTDISPKLLGWLNSRNEIELISRMRSLLDSETTVILWTYELLANMLHDNNDGIVRLSANIVDSYIYHLEYKSDEQFYALLMLWDKTLSNTSKYLQHTQNQNIMLDLISADNLSTRLFRPIGDNDKGLVKKFFTNAESKKVLNKLLNTASRFFEDVNWIEPITTLREYLE